MGAVVADPVAPASVVSARLVGVGVVVFLANAGSLVLQLVAGRLLSPFVGSSLETWTAIIGAFLAGIAVGNAVGGKAADRSAGGRRLAMFLGLGGLSALWMLGLPLALESTGLHRLLPLSLRIPVLAAVLCFPAGFSLRTCSSTSRCFTTDSACTRHWGTSPPPSSSGLTTKTTVNSDSIFLGEDQLPTRPRSSPARTRPAPSGGPAGAAARTSRPPG
jgi:hypothetical protein